MSNNKKTIEEFLQNILQAPTLEAVNEIFEEIKQQPNKDEIIDRVEKLIVEDYEEEQNQMLSLPHLEKCLEDMVPVFSKIDQDAADIEKMLLKNGEAEKALLQFQRIALSVQHVYKEKAENANVFIKELANSYKDMTSEEFNSISAQIALGNKVTFIVLKKTDIPPAPKENDFLKNLKKGGPKI